MKVYKIAVKDLEDGTRYEELAAADDVEQAKGFVEEMIARVGVESFDWEKVEELDEEETLKVLDSQPELRELEGPYGLIIQ